MTKTSKDKKKEARPSRVKKKFQAPQLTFDEITKDVKLYKWTNTVQKKRKNLSYEELCEKYDTLFEIRGNLHCRYCYVQLEGEAEQIEGHMQTEDHLIRKKIAKCCNLYENQKNTEDFHQKRQTAASKVLQNGDLASNCLKGVDRIINTSTAQIMLNENKTSDMYIFDKIHPEDMFPNYVPKLEINLSSMDENSYMNVNTVDPPLYLINNVRQRMDATANYDLQNEILISAERNEEERKKKEVEDFMKFAKAQKAEQIKTAALQRKFNEYKQLKGHTGLY